MYGPTLKKARIERGLTLQMAAELTHIRESYLQAIEEERFDDLPSPVQGRGFIRLYAGLLGFDPEEFVPKPVIVEATSEPLPQTDSKPKQADILEDHKTFPTISAIIAPFIEKITAKIKRRTVKSEVQSPTVAEPIAPAPVIAEPVPQPKKASSDIFREIGRILKTQRETISLPLEDVSEFTHISVNYLSALEEGEIDRLPSMVQARGLLNNYAGFLDLSTDDLLLKYADGLQARRSEAMLEEEIVPKKKNTVRFVKNLPLRNLLTMDMLIIVGLGVIIIISLVWGGISILNSQTEYPTSTVPESISEVLLSTATPTLTPAVTALPTEAPTSVLAQTKMPTQEDQNPNTIVETSTVEITTGTGTPGVLSVNPVQLILSVREPVYMQVIVDGGTQFNGRAVSGTPYSFNGANRIELITGNAGAIQAVFNNQDLGILGNIGQVVHLVFTLSGAATPTLTPSMTPTASPIPSKTPRPSNTYPPTHTPKPTATHLPTATPRPTSTPLATATK